MTAPASDPAARNTGLWLWPVGVALIAGLAASGGTFALWHDHATAQAQRLTTGDLSVSSLGEPRWYDTSDDVADAPRAIDPTEFLVRSGDTVAIEFPFETTLDGDNLAAELTVGWSSDTPAGVTGTYELSDATGQPLTNHPVDLGQASTFRVETSSTYTVTVKLDFAQLPDRFGPEAPDHLTTLGDFDIALQQLRPEADAS